MENVEHLILEHLKALRSEVASLRSELRENTVRLGRLELGIAALRREAAYHDETAAEQSVRIDRLVERIERIERRLDLEPLSPA